MTTGVAAIAATAPPRVARVRSWLMPRGGSVRRRARISTATLAAASPCAGAATPDKARSPPNREWRLCCRAATSSAHISNREATSVDAAAKKLILGSAEATPRTAATM